MLWSPLHNPAFTASLWKRAEEKRMTLHEVKRNIGQLRSDAEADREGSLVDLANILLRVIHNFEHMGRDYIVDRYWKR